MDGTERDILQEFEEEGEGGCFLISSVGREGHSFSPFGVCIFTVGSLQSVAWDGEDTD